MLTGTDTASAILISGNFCLYQTRKKTNYIFSFQGFLELIQFSIYFESECYRFQLLFFQNQLNNRVLFLVRELLLRKFLINEIKFAELVFHNRGNILTNLKQKKRRMQINLVQIEFLDTVNTVTSQQRERMRQIKFVNVEFPSISEVCDKLIIRKCTN